MNKVLVVQGTLTKLGMEALYAERVKEDGREGGRGGDYSQLTISTQCSMGKCTQVHTGLLSMPTW